MSVFFQVLAALIVFAWLVGWAYERTQKQREQAIERAREQENLRQWREMREKAIALNNGTYTKAKYGRHSAEPRRNRVTRARQLQQNDRWKVRDDRHPDRQDL